MMKQAYFVEILRPADGSDTTKGGVSSRFTHGFLYRGAVPANHPDGYAALILDDEPVWLGTKSVPYICAHPAGQSGAQFGGNYVMGDSGFRKEVNEYPIPVHDRIGG
jgi:hypothetical protein